MVPPSRGPGRDGYTSRMSPRNTRKCGDNVDRPSAIVSFLFLFVYFGCFVGRSVLPRVEHSACLRVIHGLLLVFTPASETITPCLDCRLGFWCWWFGQRSICP